MDANLCPGERETEAWLCGRLIKETFITIIIITTTIIKIIMIPVITTYSITTSITRREREALLCGFLIKLQNTRDQGR